MPDGDFLPPHELTPKRLIHWSKHFMRLEKDDDFDKAVSLLECDCIQYVGHDYETGFDGVYICLPLNKLAEYTEVMPGGARVYIKKPYTYNYNKLKTKAHKLFKAKIDGTWTWWCTCQGWHTKHKLYLKLKAFNVDTAPSGFKIGGINCEHVRALYGHWDIKNWPQERERVLEQMRSGAWV